MAIVLVELEVLPHSCGGWFFLRRIFASLLSLRSTGFRWGGLLLWLLVVLYLLLPLGFLIVSSLSFFSFHR